MLPEPSERLWRAKIPGFHSIFTGSRFDGGITWSWVRKSGNLFAARIKLQITEIDHVSKTSDISDVSKMTLD
ncbi:MAG: hypothetical protein WCF20_09035 [Methylovirgula sp.]